MGNPEYAIRDGLGGEAAIVFRYRRDDVNGLDWAVVLLVRVGSKEHIVRSYDNAHGWPEMHRYERGVKQPGERIPSTGSANLDLPAVIREVKRGYERMIESWDR